MIHLPKGLNRIKTAVLKGVTLCLYTRMNPKRHNPVNSHESSATDEQWVRINHGPLCFFQPLKGRSQKQRDPKNQWRFFLLTSEVSHFRVLMLTLSCLMAVWLLSESLELKRMLNDDHLLSAHGRRLEVVGESQKTALLDAPLEDQSVYFQLNAEKPAPSQRESSLNRRIPLAAKTETSKVIRSSDLDPFKCKPLSVKHPKLSQPLANNSLQKDLWYVCR